MRHNVDEFAATYRVVHDVPVRTRNIPATTHPLYRTQDKPDLTISSLRSRDILQRARGWTPMNVMNCASQLTVASGGHGSARWSLGQA